MCAFNDRSLKEESCVCSFANSSRFPQKKNPTKITTVRCIKSQTKNKCSRFAHFGQNDHKKKFCEIIEVLIITHAVVEMFWTNKVNINATFNLNISNNHVNHVQRWLYVCVMSVMSVLSCERFVDIISPLLLCKL